MPLPNYSPRALSMSVHLMLSDMTEDYPILSTFFTGPGRRREHMAYAVDITLVNGTKETMAYLSIYDSNSVGRRTKKQSLVVTLGKFGEDRVIKAGGGLISLRDPDMEDYHTMQIDAELRRENEDLLGTFLLSLEYMCAKSLMGSITMPDGDGNLIEVANWNLPAEHTPDAYTGSNRWDQDDSQPQKDVRNAKRLIRRAVLRSPQRWYGVAGHNAISALEDNKALRGDGGLLDLDMIARKLKLDGIIEYSADTYNPDTQAYTPIIGDDEFVIVGDSPGFFRLHYYSIASLMQELKMLAGQNTSAAAMNLRDLGDNLVFSDLDISKAPRGLVLTFESYPLPACHAPGNVVVLKPVGGGN